MTDPKHRHSYQTGIKLKFKKQSLIYFTEKHREILLGGV